MGLVRSRRNPRVAEALKLRRAKSDRILLEGPQVLAAALEADLPTATVFSLEESDLTRLAAGAGTDVVLVSEDLMKSLADTQHPRGPVAVAERPAVTRAATRELLVLWGLQDPGNVGTLIRSAAVFGLGVVVASTSADPWGPKAIRASAGGCFSTLVEHRPDLSLAELGERGYLTVGMVTEGGAPPEALPSSRPIALLIGSESTGLPPPVRAAIDLEVTIPMPGWQGSLNAAAAGAIVAYLSARNRRRAQKTSD